MRQRDFRLIELGLGVAVVLLALVAWATARSHAAVPVTVFDIFPVFGLLAFSLMWAGFVSGALARYLGVRASGKDMYVTLSMGIVLALIILHPGLLWYELWHEGFGLPPVSYLTVYSSQVAAVLMGSVSLCIFLAFELRRWFGKRRWWRYVGYAQYLAMVLIFFHALALGGELGTTWFRIVWYFYGMAFIAAAGYNYWYDRTHRKGET